MWYILTIIAPIFVLQIQLQNHLLCRKQVNLEDYQTIDYWMMKLHYRTMGYQINKKLLSAHLWKPVNHLNTKNKTVQKVHVECPPLQALLTVFSLLTVSWGFWGSHAVFFSLDRWGSLVWGGVGLAVPARLPSQCRASHCWPGGQAGWTDHLAGQYWHAWCSQKPALDTALAVALNEWGAQSAIAFTTTPSRPSEKRELKGVSHEI